MTRAQNNQTTKEAQDTAEEPRIFKLLPGRQSVSPSRTEPEQIFGWKSISLAIVAVLFGMIAMLSGSFQYKCKAELNIVGVPQDSIAEYRRQLLEVVQKTSESGEPAKISNWTVTQGTDSHVLSLFFFATPHKKSDEALHTVLNNFSTHLTALQQHDMNTPGEAEKLLGRRLSSQERELATLVAMATSDDLSAPVDPRPTREAIRHTMDAHRDSYEALHKELTAAQEEQKKLQTVPLARNGRTTQDERETAHQLDVRLSQDMKALGVRLADARREMLSIQRRTRPLLDDLLTISRSVAGAEITEESSSGLSAEFRAAADAFQNGAETYAGIISDFDRKWKASFKKLESQKNDPSNPELLEIQKNLSKHLGDVLYDTVESLSEMQEQITILSTANENAARFHTLVAGLQRGMQRIRTAHRQFEFTASDIRTLHNPQLDAAIKSARSLHRRIQTRSEELDARLEEAAFQQAIKDRETRLEELKTTIEKLRQETDAQVAGILSSHDEYSQSDNSLEAFIVEKMTAEQRARRVGEIKKEIETAQTELDHLQQHRQSRINPSAVKVISTNVDSTPANLAERIGWGWLVTATTLLFMLVGQWYVGNRRKSISS